ncbi:inositol 1,3,4,5,6-pentakisphosphate kinase [Schizosaccharomyces japonicus yFS275]|uniref:Inositol-pentakisphosphate 2-kinase n=1 Tax=Schizosaccharomyces japonicus (strain yFS275 / FY16936) TaxID=402676 RepID=B6JZV8_SCHJY|nr:inositol 1,3,4,5,6-pentakisphosphate kinase [Schizosaccharomyces japonicus yFS275]EEB06108.1 inositol 1,3,4,5,6-pentakisphosphate kinase [Schizosaccharomyces japonicus yFS275]
MPSIGFCKTSPTKNEKNKEDTQKQFPVPVSDAQVNEWERQVTSLNMSIRALIENARLFRDSWRCVVCTGPSLIAAWIALYRQIPPEKSLAASVGTLVEWNKALESQRREVLLLLQPFDYSILAPCKEVKHYMKKADELVQKRTRKKAEFDKLQKDLLSLYELHEPESQRHKLKSFRSSLQRVNKELDELNRVLAKNIPAIISKSRTLFQHLLKRFYKTHFQIARKMFIAVRPWDCFQDDILQTWNEEFGEIREAMERLQLLSGTLSRTTSLSSLPRIDTSVSSLSQNNSPLYNSAISESSSANSSFLWLSPNVPDTRYKDKTLRTVKDFASSPVKSLSSTSLSVKSVNPPTFSFQQSDYSVLPEESLNNVQLVPEDWSFLASGNANAVFEYTGKDPYFRGKVLRVRRRGQTLLSQDVHSYFYSTIRPLFQGFEKHLLDITLLPTTREFLEALQKTSNMLLNLNDTSGIIMRDLNEGLEMKPKWLSQSPTAPTDWVVCRTCAICRMRGKPVGFCPLRLDPDNWERFSSALRNVVSGNVARRIYNSGILKRLRSLQKQFETSNISLAMTLRDVTLYIGVTGITIIDLDPKDGNVKQARWEKDEKDLIQGGWYYGRGMKASDQPCRSV